jgi:molybdenum cofactor biosynthesis enzyme MoaA
MKGFNEDEILPFIEFIKNKNVYLRFIEYMPFDGNKWSDKKIMKYEEIKQLIETKYKMEKLQDAENDTAKGYRIEGIQGKVGFITSMSDHFCGTCNRLRITADGNFKVCLFDNREVSLRDLIRSGSTEEEIYAIINKAVKGKFFSHGGKDNMYDIQQSKNRPMIKIGG